MAVNALMADRTSARKFSDKPVSRADIEEMITCAGLAPSAINLQPWEYVVTHGEEKDRLVRRLQKAQAQQQVSCGPGTRDPLPKKFSDRSKQGLSVMKPVVEELGMPVNRFIEEGSVSFYGAPVVIIVTMDRLFPKIRYLDVGMSVGYLLLAAQEKGLSTCPVGLVTAYGEDIKDALNIPEQKEVLLTLALGYADTSSELNRMKPAREPLDQILTWYE